ncbi:MAG: TetR/AcrR family transcriptional regulator [Acidimicrobiaceae bacterium]|nr:TetR/AcrR family transcriptional regulator [Acidimicrobiaceae bacterium]
MPRSPSPHTRSLLIERAASLLAAREPVTLRSLVAGTGVSTMAVYTYFDGMDGLWSAVREEGFRRLAERIADVRAQRDPVRHLASLGVAYVENAVAHPDLFRVMFDGTIGLSDRSTADSTFDLLVAASRDAIHAGRFSPTADPADTALQFWASGHGAVMLGITGVLQHVAIVRLARDLQAAVFVHAGDTPANARRSVNAAWREIAIPEPG